MLTLALDDSCVSVRPIQLSDTVVLAWWDADGPPPGPGLSADFGTAAAAKPPLAVLTLPAEAGWVRTIAVIRRRAAGDRHLRITTRDGRPLAAGTVDAAVGLTPAAANALGADLAPVARVRLIRFLVETCTHLMRLGSDPVFAASCTALVGALFPDVAPVRPLATLTPRLMLAETVLAAPVQRIERAITLGKEIKTYPYPLLLSDRTGTDYGTGTGTAAAAGTDGAGRCTVRLALEPADATAGTLVLLLTDGGLHVGRAVRPDHCPALADWLRQGAPLSGRLREGLLTWLTLCRDQPEARAAAHLLQVVRPLPRRIAVAEPDQLAAEIELAITDRAGGVFVSGWLHDPAGLVEGLELTDPLGRRRPLPHPPLRFARDDLRSRLALTPAAAAGLGLVAYVPADGTGLPVLQQRLALRLHAGGRIDLGPPPQPTDPAAVRSLLLAALPPQAITDPILETCLAPALAAAHAAVLAGPRDPVWSAFGPSAAGSDPPEVSLIVPLYRTLDFLRFQFAAFAVDPDLHAAELILVLDSPEDAPRLVRLLAGLQAVFDLPVRLAVMPRNLGYAAANNAAAAGACGRKFLFLNSDVVPDRPGWLGALTDALDRHPETAAVGAKLLYEDDSLQHAGLWFERDFVGAGGRWHNRHFWKGLPRHFPPAGRGRPVPALTGACLLVQRDRFLSAGGFCEDYVIGDFEDSDLCLRLRAAGAALRYVPEAELYHFERRSIARHVDHARGVATRYNEWLHHQRWDTAITALMREFAEQPPGAGECRPLQRVRTAGARS